MSDGSNSAFGRKVKRCEKSLCEITRRFLLTVQNKDQAELHLDHLIQILSIERRRIYDIINILEGIGMVERKAKNTY